jgi:amidase
MTEIHERDAVALAAAIRTAELSPVEVVEHFLDRIDRYGNTVGAFVTVIGEAARAQASAAVSAVNAGDPRPLLGVPTAIKDLTPTDDAPVTFGSAAFAGLKLPQAHVSRLLAEAGTINLGKTNTAEFGLSAYTETVVGGSARTPWDVTRSAGGSSGGSAAAVAAGLVPFAHGNDGGGSLRIPASVCGVVGFKPSRGRISNGPLADDVTGMACQGPLTSTVRDAAITLDAMSIVQPGDDVHAPALPPGDSFAAAADRAPGRLRIARYADAGVAVDPACRAAYDAASALLDELGHDVVDVADPFGSAIVEPFATTWAVRSLRIPVPPDAEDRLLPSTRWWRQRGRAISAETLLHALTTLRLAARQALEKLSGFDVVLTPTLALPPQPPKWFTEPADPEDQFRRQHLFSPYAAAANLTGQPSASLPLHWTEDGLPIGVMLTGPPGQDALLLSLCAQVENARPWAHRVPPLPA